MLPIGVGLLFVAAAFVTSALSHDPRRWRYAFGLLVACAIPLAWWGGALLARFGRVGGSVWFAAMVLVAALPLAIVVAHLVRRRRQTPLHTPSIDDDPVLRRHLAEKVRRHRLRRQEEAEIEDAGGPLP